MEQTDRPLREESWGDWKRLAKEHICIYANPMGTDHSVVKAGGGGTGSGGEQGWGIGGGRKWSHR